jgi:hypothetical protein
VRLLRGRANQMRILDDVIPGIRPKGSMISDGLISVS